MKLCEKVKLLFSGEKSSACGTADRGEQLPSGDKSGRLDTGWPSPSLAGTVLNMDFFWGSEESRRADAGRGEARSLGTVVGVARGRLESRRPAGVGRVDRRLVLTGVLTLLTRLCVAEDHLMGVLWATLPTDVQDCGRCARQDFGVAPAGGSPVENLGILN